jgi:stage II sporulation protein E
MVKELNRTYAKYQLSRLWRQQVQQGRELVVNQMYGVSKMMDSAAADLDRQLAADARLEGRMMAALEKADVKCYDVSIVRNIDGRHEAVLVVKGAGAETLETVASGVLGVRMQVVGTSGALRRSVRLAERERLRVVCAGSSRAKDGETDCGDHYCCAQLDGGKYAVLISDGMGAGSAAAKQSRTVIELMQRFLNAGFEKQQAAIMVNSALLLKNGTECSATIDAAVFDLYCGVAEFIKIGANTGYIKRGKKVEPILSGSMPAGILKTVDADVTTRTVRAGDRVVLVSDGIEGARDAWLTEFLGELPALSADTMSKQILREAARRKNGRIDDDMTVVVAEICEG